MLPTFVVGLREGLEASLIVSIVAAFLRKQGRADLLRWVLAGVAVAAALCLGAGIALRVYSQDLPQKQQEGLETVIGALAVGMVTYMVVWMRRHSRDLKGQLEHLAAGALGGRGNAGRALVLMAFLAVIREGLETVVFALAAFNLSTNSTAAGFGLLLGVAAAVVLGYAIYRGGVRLNLSKFFRVTGVVLVLVAAGLVVNALRTAHEAGWFNVGQGGTVDLSGLVDPGSVRSSLLTGMLGLQPYPVTIEVLGWLLYLVPVGIYVAWPPGRTVPWRGLRVVGAVVATAGVLAGFVCLLLAPSAPSPSSLTLRSGEPASTATVVARVTHSATVRILTADRSESIRLTGGTDAEHGGRPTWRFSARAAVTAPNLPATLSIEQVARLNGGQLPIGIGSAGGRPVAARYAATRTTTVWIDRPSGRIVDLVRRTAVTVTVTSGSVSVPIDDPVSTTTIAPSAADRSRAVASAADAARTLDHRARAQRAATWLFVLAGAGLLLALASSWWLTRRRPPEAPSCATPQLAPAAS